MTANRLTEHKTTLSVDSAKPFTIQIQHSKDKLYFNERHLKCLTIDFESSLAEKR